MKRRALLALPLAGAAGLAAAKMAGATPSLGTVYDVTDYGLVGNGAADNLGPWQTLMALAPQGSTIVIPPGNYLFGGTPTLPKPLTLVGADPHTAKFSIGHETADGLAVTAVLCNVRQLGFTSPAVRTGGSLVNVTAGRTLLRDLALDRYYTGITLNGATSSHVENVFGGPAPTGANVAPGGSFMQVGPNFAADLHVRSVTCNSQGGDAMPSYGILVLNAGDLTIADSLLLQHGDSLALMPGSGAAAASVNVAHSYFDTCTRGLYVMPSGTGIVMRCSFNQTWFASGSGGGVEINAPAGSNQVSQFSFNDCQFLRNGQHGVLLNGGQDIHLNGGFICESAQDGVRVASGNVKHWSVANMRIGDTARFAGNGGRGIRVMPGATDYYRIANNDLEGNALGGLLDAGTGTHKYVAGNLS